MKYRNKLGRFQKGHKVNTGNKHSKITKEKISNSNKGNKYCLGFKHTEETKKNMSFAQIGKKSVEWKTKNPSYGSVHTWLLKHHKNTKTKCHKCDGNRFLEWALKKGKKHTHNLNNYWILCSSCHKKYDYTDERRKKLSETFKKKYANKT